MECLLSFCIENDMQVEHMMVNELRTSYNCDCNELPRFRRQKVDVYEDSGIRPAL